LLTYPQAMSPSQRSNIEEAWKQVQEELGFGDTITKKNFIVESWAPYARLRSKGIGINDICVNIDIGGGSTDVFYINPQQKGANCFTYSVNYAANDLWGVGNDSANKNDKTNGFIDVCLKKEEATVVKTNIETYQTVANDASDVISYLFATYPNFGRSISSHPVHSIVIIHFASIVYYLSLILKSEDLECPKILSFTGMGSKYLDMIAGFNNKESIKNLINTVFELNGLDHKIEEIERDPNPKEVTAEGAVLTEDTVNKALSPQGGTVYGIEDEEDEVLKGKDIKNGDLKKRAVNQVMKFLDILFDEKFIDAVKQCGRDFNPEWLKEAGLDTADSKCKEMLEASFQLVENTIRDNDKINDALFFWPLKDTLYRAAVALSKVNINEFDE